MFSRYLNSHIH